MKESYIIVILGVFDNQYSVKGADVEKKISQAH